MPLIAVKVFEGELTQQQTTDLIRGITETVIPFVRERLREATWVLVEEVKSGAWGIGGKPFGLPDLRKIQQSAAAEQERHERLVEKRKTKQ
jgi:4-oxalocrotonate tautomerase